jgi:hypothetical protein
MSGTLEVLGDIELPLGIGKCYKGSCTGGACRTLLCILTTCEIQTPCRLEVCLPYTRPPFRVRSKWTLTRPHALHRDLKAPIIRGNSKTPPLRGEGRPRRKCIWSRALLLHLF